MNLNGTKNRGAWPPRARKSNTAEDNPSCPYCGSKSHKHGRGRYICYTCGRTFKAFKERIRARKLEKREKEEVAV